MANNKSNGKNGKNGVASRAEADGGGIEVEYVPPGDLTLDPANVRRHGERNMQAVRDSLKAFGPYQPLAVVDADGIVRVGNARIQAAMDAGYERVPIVRTSRRGAEAQALAIADNRTSELAEWDDGLADVLAGLQRDGGIDHLATGFTDEEIASLVSGGGADWEPEQDDPPGPPADPVTRQGDVWVMGELGHRVMCGDCRGADDVGRLLSGDSINVAVTSPPYASQREYDESSGFKPIPTDEYVAWFDAVQRRVAEHLAGDGSWLINIKEHCEDGQRVLYVRDLVLRHVREWGWRFVDEFAWVHGGTPKAPNARFKNGWEPIFQFTRGKHKFRPDAVAHQSNDVPDWSGLHPNAEDVQRYGSTEGMARKGVDARSKKGDGVGGKQGYGDGVGAREAGAVGSGMAYPSNVVKAGKNKDALGHSAAYPVGLPSFFIRALTDEGDNAYDPFLGSGTTLIAAHQLGRRCFGMEISPQYCDVICKRYLNLTGESPVRESDGAKFSELTQ